MSQWFDDKCGKTVHGSRAEHCPSCHETFNSTAAGDAHRVDFRCVEPGSLRREDGNPRLELDARGQWRVWQTPEQRAALAAFAEKKKREREEVPPSTSPPV